MSSMIWSTTSPVRPSTAVAAYSTQVAAGIELVAAVDLAEDEEDLVEAEVGGRTRRRRCSRGSGGTPGVDLGRSRRRRDRRGGRRSAPPFR